METKILQTDVLIIGGGTAGCYAAVTLAENSDTRVIIAEKAHIKRSGCLAAGVNALNAHINKGRKPEEYVDYAKKDAHGIVREDLLLSMARGLNRVTKRLEDMGLVILKDENGDYAARGNWNIKINGENIKPILAREVSGHGNITVLNRVNVFDYIVADGAVSGAVGFGVEEEVLYIIRAKAVICAAGGASGLYKPNNPGYSRHKMWYPPFNTGAGYAMGIRAGAEMTTFEMRFIALRCKDTIAPTGTLAQGVGAKQINSLGEVYESKYGLTTSERLYGTVMENRLGRGPCYLRTEGISDQQNEDLKKAYLNMAPSQTLKWLESGKNPSEENVEIEGTEPYIIGGHTASGYWVDNGRATTLKGLYAAGDVAGGCPQKYVTGALVEGELAALAALEYIKQESPEPGGAGAQIQAKLEEAEAFLHNPPFLYTAEYLEEAMQKVMDTYAGGIKTDYAFNEKQLQAAKKGIQKVMELSKQLSASTMQELLHIYELTDRLTVCRSVIAHLEARKETRWHCFAENLDYPETSDEWLRYVNSRLEDGEIKIILRDLVRIKA